MNYHNFYGPFQISENKVYFKGMYSAFDLKNDAELIRTHAQMAMSDLKAQYDEWSLLVDSLDEMDEADYWNDQFRKDGLSWQLCEQRLWKN